eukprot:9097965-Pyramimonas_sp.AAC.1
MIGLAIDGVPAAVSYVRFAVWPHFWHPQRASATPDTFVMSFKSIGSIVYCLFPVHLAPLTVNNCTLTVSSVRNVE